MYNDAADYKAFTGKSALMASMKNRPNGILFFGRNAGTLRAWRGMYGRKLWSAPIYSRLKVVP